MDIDRRLQPPTHCPGCGTELIVPHLTHSRLARRLRIVAFAVTPLWILTVWYYLAFNSDVAAGLSDEGFMGLMAVPMVILLGWSARLRRVLPFECYRCGWRHEYGGSMDAGLFTPARHGLKKDRRRGWMA